jgi:hypothetical protein
MNKLFFVLIGLVLISNSVFALTREEYSLAVNTFTGNQLRVPLMLGTYNTGIVITKDKPTDSFWFACFPVFNNPQFNYSCLPCRSCN